MCLDFGLFSAELSYMYRRNKLKDINKIQNGKGNSIA